MEMKPFHLGFPHPCKAGVGALEEFLVPRSHGEAAAAPGQGHGRRGATGGANSKDSFHPLHTKSLHKGMKPKQARAQKIK